MPVVFISYAHESAALSQQVRLLADWLGARQCRVLTDHPYLDRPPGPGWQTWMLQSVREADVVLVVCTPMLKARYEGTAPPGLGRGAGFEGAIVTQSIYDDMMVNTKFYPVVPDGGSDADIPTTLRPWANGHAFPSGNERIVRLIRGPSTSGTTPAPGSDSMGSDPVTSETSREGVEVIPDEQRQLAQKLLAGAGVRPFLEAVCRELHQKIRERSGSSPPAIATTDVVDVFAGDHRQGTEALVAHDPFVVVRRALRPTESIHDANARLEIERAAAALYCLAACRLVRQEAHRTRAALDGSQWVVQVTSDDHLVCAIIATALFGGELHLEPAESGDEPRVPHVYWVPHAVGAERSVDFERAVYLAVFRNVETTTGVALESGPLTPEQRAHLAVRLSSFREVYDHTVALVVRHDVDAGTLGTFGNRYRVPVLIPSSAVATQILGMDAADLSAHIGAFWKELAVLPKREAPDASRPAPSAGPTAQANPPAAGVNVHVSGGHVSFATGHGSVSQAGAANDAHLTNRQQGETDDAVLLLIQALSQAIQSIPSTKAQEALPHAQTLEAEIAKPPGQRIPDVFRRALDSITSIGDTIEGGDRILDVCGKLVRILGPFIGT